jgi:hypothetical protein
MNEAIFMSGAASPAACSQILQSGHQIAAVALEADPRAAGSCRPSLRFK